MSKDTDTRNDTALAAIEKELLSNVGESLRERSENLDPETSSALDQIRMQALEAAEKPKSPWFMQPVYGGAVAAGLVAAIALLSLNSSPTQPELPYFETVILNSDFEMLAEDLEFYEWMELELEEGGV